MPGKQRVRPLAPLAWIGDPSQRRCVSMHQGLGGGHVGIVGATRLRATPLHGFIDDRAIDALDLQLAPERALAAGAGSVPRLDPRLRERRVVEDAKPEQPLDRAVDELRSITGLREAPPEMLEQLQAAPAPDPGCALRDRR